MTWFDRFRTKPETQNIQPRNPSLDPATKETLQEHITYGRQSYILQQNFQPSSSYLVNRSLFSERGETRNGSTILDFLPTYQEKTLIDLLEEKVKKADEKHPVEILDIGCGAGTALKEIKERYKEKVKVYGLTATAYDQEKVDGEITVGNINDLRRIYPQASFDIIYSCRALTYAGRNLMNIYPKIYRLLKDDGIALLDCFPENRVSFCDVKGFNALNKWFVDNGYDMGLQSSDDWLSYYNHDMTGEQLPTFEEEERSDDRVITHFTMRKTHEYLRIPITYDVALKATFDSKKAARFSELLHRKS